MSVGISKQNNNAARRGGKELVYGVGVNDADYVAEPTINGRRVRCPAYSAWTGMLKRAYSEKYQEKRPTYKGVVVCDEWHSFMSFRHWWLESQVDGWHMDKDVLSDDRIYSPETCIFLPVWLNSFTIDSGAARGEWPIGVCFYRRRGKFKSRCRHPFGKNEFLGYFSTPDEAHAAWLARKLEIAHELKHLMDDIDARIFPRVIEIISRSK